MPPPFLPRQVGPEGISGLWYTNNTICLAGGLKFLKHLVHFLQNHWYTFSNKITGVCMGAGRKLLSCFNIAIWGRRSELVPSRQPHRHPSNQIITRSVSMATLPSQMTKNQAVSLKITSHTNKPNKPRRLSTLRRFGQKFKATGRAKECLNLGLSQSLWHMMWIPPILLSSSC